MNQTVLQKDITKELGLDGLTDEEKVVFLNNIGDTVLEAALLRLVASLTADQQQALEQFLETEPEPEVLLQHLLEHHKDFESMLEAEIVAFKEEALTVLGEAKLNAE